MVATSWVTMLATFVGAMSAVLLAFGLLRTRDQRVDERLGELTGPSSDAMRIRQRNSKPFEGSLATLHSGLTIIGSRLLPTSETQRELLQMRLVQAGIYSPSAVPVYLAVKMLLALVLPFGGVLAGNFGLIDMQTTLLICAGMAMMGMLIPGLWLDRRNAGRQTTFRRSLPDFLDLIVTCLESGLSFEGALQRVCDELRTAHPLLAGEMGIVQREIALGRTTDVALRNFADRCGLDVVKTLATYVQQANKFGASIADSLRDHSDMLRVQREQRAEELAQKASVKIMFPTLLFIFPAIFVVLVGPAAIDIYEKFSGENAGILGEESPQQDG